MTTIAWDGKTIASDSQSAGTYVDQHGATKIVKRDGKIIAGSGRFSTVCEYFDGNTEFDDESYFIEIDQKTGKARVIEAKGSYPIKPPQDIGSGCDFAMGAMLAGKSASEAVKIAIKLDSNSGGKVKAVIIK